MMSIPRTRVICPVGATAVIAMLLPMAEMVSPANAASINAVDAIYDLDTEALELFFDFADTSDSVTPNGLRTMGIDFDLVTGEGGPFRNTLDFQGPAGSTIRSYNPVLNGKDTVIVEFAETLFGPQAFSMLFQNVDTRRIDASSNRSVDLQLNRDAVEIIGQDLPPNGFEFQRLDIITNAVAGTVSLSTPGDFNGDGLLSSDDLNQLTSEIHSGATAALFDLDQSGTVNLVDREYWVTNLKSTWIGDANLDGEFNSTDFIEVFQAGKYDTSEVARWSEGDWDGDVRFDSSDFVAAFQDGGYELGSRAAVAAVPEPSGLMLLTLGLLNMIRSRRRS